MDFQTIKVLCVDPDNSLQIFLNPKELDYGIKNTSSDLNTTTNGYALTFFYEIFHTPFHNNFPHDNKGHKMPLDGPVIFENIIRKELSKATNTNLEQRMFYNFIHHGDGKPGFIAFTPEAKIIYDKLIEQWIIFSNLRLGDKEGEKKN
ncbi:hypothetical protein [Ferruginibacter profundus]